MQKNTMIDRRIENLEKVTKYLKENPCIADAVNWAELLRPLVFKYRHEGKTYQQISNKTGIKIGTVKYSYQVIKKAASLD